MPDKNERPRILQTLYVYVFRVALRINSDNFPTFN